jgi:UDP-N-acetylmuramoylalanine--D-glutamate ligase
MKRSEIAGRSFVVFGAARSGIGVARLLARLGARVTLIDEKSPNQAPPEAAALSALGVRCLWGPDCPAALTDAQVLVKSPGVPQTNPLVQQARARGVRIVSEIEVAGALLPEGAKLVAITGTNGKTTTTAWIAHLLTAAGFEAVACGNIGRAFSDAVAEKLDAPPASRPLCFVAEISSFQLEDVEDFRPDVAVLTNLAPDHLDRYASYREYVAAKENMVRNMGPRDAFVWNADNPDSASFAAGASVRRYAFSTRSMPLSGGAGVKDGYLVIEHDEIGSVALVREQDLPLVGRHNVENALASALAAFLAGASLAAIREGLLDFPGVEHRIELCGERDGVRFFNDSKATNVDSLEKALLSFSSPVILIAGGRDKKSDYTTLTPLVRERVKALLTIGEAAPLIENAWAPWVPTERVASMEDAVRRAAQLATAGDVVLLSPACASYDMYRNFEERGRHFKECVARLLAAS